MAWAAMRWESLWRLAKAVTFDLRLVQHGFQAGDDFTFGPEVVLEVLHPLEVGNGDAAGIAEHVRDDEDIATGVEDAVRLRGGGAVGAFC